MIRTSLPASLVLVAVSAAAAQALTPDEEALLSGRKAPVVTTTKKTATPTPVPSAPAVAVPFVQETPRFTLPGFLPAVPAGELSWQEAGQSNLDPTATGGFGNSRMGLSLHGEEGDVLWNLRTGLARQNQLWQLSDLGAVAFFGTQSHVTLGDETVTFGQLLIDDMPVRGGHVRYGADDWVGEAFLGVDRPVLAGFASDRTMGGAGFELPKWGPFELARLRVVGQDDRLAGRRGGAIALGSRTALGPVRLDAELAASGGNEPPDTGYRLEGAVPWSLFTFKASHMRQGPYFQTVRTLGMPTGGTRLTSQASVEAAPWPGLKSVLALTGNDVGADGAAGPAAQASTGSRGVDWGLSFAPEMAGWSANLNVSRTAFNTAFAASRFAMTLDRVSPELRVPLPYLPGARARWDWLVNTPEGGTAVPTHLITFDAGRVAGTGLSFMETMTLVNAGARLNHAANWNGTLWGQRLIVGGRGFVEHPIGMTGSEGRYGLNGSLGVLVTADQAIDLVGTIDRGFAGQPANVSWSARYSTHFGQAPGHAAEATAAVIEGRLEAPPGLTVGQVTALQVRLGRNQYTNVGPDGRFRFANLAPGAYDLALDISRLPTGFTIAPSAARRSVQAEAGKVASLSFPLAVAHRVGGRVTDAAGAGVEGVEVALVAGADRYAAWTDAQGRYMLEDVVAGAYQARPALETDPRYEWTGEPTPVGVGPTGTPEVDFQVRLRTRHLELPGTDPFAMPESKPTPVEPTGAVTAPGLEAVVLPHPVKSGHKAVLKVLVRGKVIRLRALAGGRWVTLTQAGRSVYQATFKAPTTARPLVGTVDVELTTAAGTRRHRLTYRIIP